MTRLYRAFACFCLFSLLAYAVSAQDTSIAFGPSVPGGSVSRKRFNPCCSRRSLNPWGLVRPVRDSSAFQGWRMEPAGDMQQFYDMTYKRGTPSVIVDFGRHVTGYFFFRCIPTVGRTPQPVSGSLSARCLPNSPLSFDPYPGGLSRGGCRTRS